MPTSLPEGFYVQPDDFARVEKKVDKCLEAIERLVLIDERQVVQGQRMGQLEQRLAADEATHKADISELWTALNTARTDLAAQVSATERKLDKWINFGMGAWALASTIFVIWQGLSK